MDEALGLIHPRVPTWAPFRLQFYRNGHSRLARQLAAEDIAFATADNAFIRIADWQRARDLADGFSSDEPHRVLDRYAALCWPVLDIFGQTYHWSPMQVEYATDVVFRSAATGATSTLSLRWMTSPPGFAPRSGSPGPGPSATGPSRASTSSRRATAPCRMPCKTPRSTVPVSDGAICFPA